MPKMENTFKWSAKGLSPLEIQKLQQELERINNEIKAIKAEHANFARLDRSNTWRQDQHFFKGNGLGNTRLILGDKGLTTSYLQPTGQWLNFPALSFVNDKSRLQTNYDPTDPNNVATKAYLEAQLLPFQNVVNDIANLRRELQDLRQIANGYRAELDALNAWKLTVEPTLNDFVNWRTQADQTLNDYKTNGAKLNQSNTFKRYVGFDGLTRFYEDIEFYKKLGGAAVTQVASVIWDTSTLKIQSENVGDQIWVNDGKFTKR